MSLDLIHEEFQELTKKNRDREQLTFTYKGFRLSCELALKFFKFSICTLRIPTATIAGASRKN